MEYIKLNNGVEMPKLGLGVFQMNDDQVRQAVPAALESGYRLIDTASRYYNEKAVGAALAEADVPARSCLSPPSSGSRIMDTPRPRRPSRLPWTSWGSTTSTSTSSISRLATITARGARWRNCCTRGVIQAIGVSNFFADRYFDLLTHNRIVPAVNQLETHLLNQQIATQDLLRQHGTVLQAWSPLAQGHQDVFTDLTLTRIAQAHGKTLAQVILRWLIQRDIPVVVKSIHPSRLRENIDVFDFQLTEDDMQAIAGLDWQQVLAGFTHQDPRMLELLLTLD